ncbi:NASP-related protein sim3 [Spathaspora sp. JA1]|nr:NASP-related protein sim3 [Spathaspora sp. JA1]
MSLYSEEISKLVAEGSRAYSAKEFDLASERYAQACEQYAEEHEGGDDSDLLFLYGKAVFQSAVSKSEVFGAAPERKNEEENGDEEEGENQEDDDKFQFYDAEPVEGEVAKEEDEDEEDEEGPQLAEEEEEEEDNGKGKPPKEEEAEEEQTDFEVAWEIIDLTRTLLEKKLTTLSHDELTPPYLQTDKEETNNEYIITLTKLSQSYDILGEISLETENFPQASIDFQKCLDLRLKLYNPENSKFLSESHYKLSLALEFCVNDPQSKQKAATQLKLAIESVERRNKHETDENVKKENAEIIQDLQVKYEELNKETSDDLTKEQMDVIEGILGHEAGSSGNASSSIVNNLTSMVKKKTAQPVNDLSSMVKKRKAPKPDVNGVKKSKSE